MYVCNCNGLKSRDVEAAIEAGARSPRAVHAHHGCTPQCARCLPEMGQRIRDGERQSPCPLTRAFA